MSESPLGEPTLAALCAEVREALAKATPGEWRVENGGLGQDDHMHQTTIDAFADPTRPWSGGDGVLCHNAMWPLKPDDAALIASAPTWLARLVDGVTELEEEVSNLRQCVVTERRRLLAAEAEVTALRARLSEIKLTHPESGAEFTGPEAWALALASITALQSNLAEEAEQLKWTERALAVAKDYVAELKDENDALRAKLADAEAREDQFIAMAMRHLRIDRIELAPYGRGKWDDHIVGWDKLRSAIAPEEK